MLKEIEIKIKTLDHCPAEPENGFPYATTVAEELEFFIDGELVEDEKLVSALQNYIFDNFRDEIDIEAHEDVMKRINRAIENALPERSNDYGGFW